MSEFLQTNGDYNVKTKEGGIIKLDVGPPTSGGQVIVTANLIVEGDTLTVEAENLNVKDNIIQLNYGETGAGVSLRYSGLQIDRGTLSPASFFWDENDDSFNLATGSPESAFNYSNSTLRLKTITTDTASPDLVLIGYGDGVITVAGTNDYENQVTNDDDIPNKKYVDDSIRDNPTFQIIDDNTRVIVTDKEVAGSLAYLTSNTGYSTFGESAVSVLVDGTLNTQFYTNRALIQGLEFNQNEPNNPTITVNNTNDNIYLQTNGTGKLRTNYGLQLEEISVDPAYVSGSTIAYAKEPSIGDTGLFYRNSNNSTDELISKNKALLFSMIF
jgi:archaellum component FlaG (FlaF/FlaG flagellin family)